MSASSSGQHAAHLMQLLGLAEEELCAVLDADPLELLSGQVEDRPALPILLDLLADSEAAVAPALLRRWVRTGALGQRPLDRLLARDFAAFEDALGELARDGFVVRRRP